MLPSTTPTVIDVLNTLLELAPAHLAESWDNSGLQAGHPHSPVARLLVALDPTEQVLEAAAEHGIQMVVTHHPLLFSPLKSIDLSQRIPGILTGFLKKQIALVSCHTNLDSSRGGVNDILAAIIGLSSTRPLIQGENTEREGTGLGRIGSFDRPRRLEEIVKIISNGLNIPCLPVVGRPDQVISTAAVCGGSGSDLWLHAVRQGADLFVSGEIKHHVAKEAEQLGLAVVDGGHFHTEWPVVPAVAEYLREKATRKGWRLEVMVLKEEKSPFTFWINEDTRSGHAIRPFSI
ncbi:MAG TPA: Nif3-like dinuclear metal center hexameric protein [Thermodesulfobacteriaceae bacterium]|nr:Nif3-like dinuclear metal center hexameric protein [Thermodesulfobacteriaceae bacterium]